jgi:hypothetical protein
MRTTLTIDDDILFAVKERARREQRSAGRVLSDLAREALNGAPSVRAAEDIEFLGFRPFPHRGGVVTNELINRLREDDLE